MVPLIEEKQDLTGSNPGQSPRESWCFERLAGNAEFSQEHHPGQALIPMSVCGRLVIIMTQGKTSMKVLQKKFYSS